ncbi:glycosyl transferase, group 1 [Desulforamulus reducens MI-1]|uniref:Glycosyl transferase, group 1 n=1 Tax=Desulforamulus reducens (strain ATCC BAA-1160 / DSM 100696 / MI-1) TaxID=349161 RepID=A4J6Z2_DESRM|nr:glycosyltransferase family 4 protein [Desulforamulus reducens]ABO50845.1 glycosyl transferase, group 1 [Desulforamulus reducens MI-1]
MRVVTFSWEYPPLSVGGLAQHVYDLTIAMARQDVDLHVITCGSPDTPDYEKIQGVHVYRVTSFKVSSPDFVTWVMQLNMAMIERFITLFHELEQVDIIHAHDWLVAYAAKVCKHSHKIPLISTIHATEWGRNNGLHNDIQRHISDIEWWLTYESWRVICCSEYMQGQLTHIFQLPVDKINIIPNGVEPTNFKFDPKTPVKRDTFANPHEKIVYYVGRLVPEKGVQVLLEAVPKILHYHPNTKFVIAGKGSFEGELKHKAVQIGISDKIYFTGYVNDMTRNSLYHYADVAVFPSLYEPFGIVALEAMAAQTPVVVSDNGGLGEIVQHGFNGMKSYTGNANSLADSILHCLMDNNSARQMKERAYNDVIKKYNWQGIAKQTRQVYQEIIDADQKAPWKKEKLIGKVVRTVAH